ncbi:MAG TPA: glycosyltransferase [Nitrosopumilaceae archaeon]|nr:glycosyltransferase [Nitrosopumilaceae archaeon]
MLIKNKTGENLSICIITSWFPNKKQPGFGTFIYLFAKSLAKFGVKVSLIVPLVGEEELVTSKDSITIYRIEGIRKGKFFLFSMMRLVNQIKPDIMHVQAPDFFSSTAIIVAKLKNIPIIATVHRGELVALGKLMHLVRKFALPRFKKIIAVSEFSKSLALNAGADVNKVMIIYNSCDESLFSRRDKLMARQRLGLPINKKVILYVGNLVKIKGVYTLIESCRILYSRIPNFFVLVVGDGIERVKLESLVASYGLGENIKFLGYLEPTTLPLYYNAADTFVLPSFVEGHSVALLEAMASGLPVVASMVGGNKETIEDGFNGFLFEAGDSVILAEKLIKILTDDNLRERMSTSGSEIYHKKFSAEVQIQNFLNLYRSLLNCSRSSSN